MIIIPAIDILKGKCVRLFKGNYKKKIFEKSYKKYLKEIIKKKPKIVHIIDLDGAKIGKPINNLEITKIINILKKKKIKTQVGGGIRKKNHLNYYLSKNTKVIISTIFFKKSIKKIKKTKNIIVSIDYKKNRVFCNGWKKKKISLNKAIKKAKKSNFNYFIFTNISKDGTQEGINFKKISYICKKLKKKKLMFAGGFNNKNEKIIKKKIKNKNLYGIITGTYFYKKCLKE